MKKLLILVLLTIMSCGARKVSKSRVTDERKESSVTLTQKNETKSLRDSVNYKLFVQDKSKIFTETWTYEAPAVKDSLSKGWIRFGRDSLEVRTIQAGAKITKTITNQSKDVVSDSQGSKTTKVDEKSDSKYESKIDKTSKREESKKDIKREADIWGRAVLIIIGFLLMGFIKSIYKAIKNHYGIK